MISQLVILNKGKNVPLKIVVSKLTASSKIFFGIKLLSELSYASVPMKQEIVAQAEKIVEDENLLLRIINTSEIEFDENFGLKVTVEMACPFMTENPELDELSRIVKRLARFLESLKTFALISEDRIEKELIAKCKEK